MKKFSILAMVLAFTMMLSVASFAAPAFKLADGTTAPEGTTVTPDADSIAVETAAVAGNYYGILLVKGDALPTVDNAILYINQATAADVTQAFDVLPNMTDLADGDKLTLYISSNVANAKLIAIPMVYADEVIVPDPEYLIGDTDGDGAVTAGDVDLIFYYAAEMYTEMLDWYGVDPEGDAFLIGADTDADGVVTAGDADLINYYAAEMYQEIYDWYGVLIGEMKASDFE